MGFVSGPDFIDDKLPLKGQMDKIHFLKSYRLLCFSHKLVGRVVQHFLQQDICSMDFFADPVHPAIKFYDELTAVHLLDEDGIF